MSTATFSGVVVDGWAVEVHYDRGCLPVVSEHDPDGGVRFHECKSRAAAERLASMLCEVHGGIGREVTLTGGAS